MGWRKSGRRGGGASRYVFSHVNEAVDTVHVLGGREGSRSVQKARQQNPNTAIIRIIHLSEAAKSNLRGEQRKAR